MLLDELKMLLALNGNRRIPHLEEEIFASKKLYTFYLEELIDRKMPELMLYNIDSEYFNSPWLAYKYALDVIKSRWTEAEAVIATSPCWSCWYAIEVIGSRWPEAEWVIAAEREHANVYNDSFETNI
jgi:hypothetical protein